MRWFALILVLVALSAASPAPEPKKYKPEIKESITNSSLTNEERQFLREVEAKFGIKSDVPVDEEKNKSDKETTKLPPKGDLPKLPFPAVIAIEIVNDTDSKGKGKRTIDANLGYGYRTNTGYSYSYFGKPQEKGKFMLYPYSQEDIPPARPNGQKNQYTKEGYTTASPNVEIQPSQAYELVPVKEEHINSYEYKKPATEFKSNYENVKGLESPPPPPYKPTQSSPSTLYTTYNGDHFSGLSGQFPSVMPNFFVDSSQLLKSPQYQSAGLTSEYIRSHRPQLEQKVVPVLVLRIPSSYLKNPSAELYANLPQNYPISQYLNNVNLQELVNQYFAKIGYSMAPQIMSYNHSPLSSPVSAPAAAAPVSSPASQYEPQHYANPYVQPAYTQADYSGVQYSAVQPVMAKYPSKYSSPQYYMAPAQAIYQHQPQQQQQYEYQYQYVQSPEAYQQYYVDNVDPEYQQISSQTHGQSAATAVDQESTVQHASAHVQYEESQAPAQQQTQEVPQTPHYRPQHLQSQQYEAQVEYELPKEDSKDDTPTKISVSSYSTPKPQYGASQEQQQYYSAKEPIQKETIAIYPSSPKSQTIQRYQYDPQSGHQNYYYQKQVGDDSASKTIVISENYPSQADTIATVLPFHKTTAKPSKSMQSVNYVTPTPFSSKYQSRYNIMVPQTVLGGATASNEKVSYVNSHSLPAHYLQSGSQLNLEEEYTTGAHHVPARSSQKAPSFPRNYHSQPKRMVKQENKPESSPSTSSRKRNDKNDKKKSS
ncbi:uncharacterized protein LOC125235491 [Leguminivora glycinivorella]|uniref:uncharacterized protein LOC125235491 n=1 Tax=Leguminivora glycinivorella TaxID=1035111 RepID=UPI00200BB4AF|nr:uncharacterized protein LOC125235491 [Leguminivora glycinivorella]